MVQYIVLVGKKALNKLFAVCNFYLSIPSISLYNGGVDYVYFEHFGGFTLKPMIEMIVDVVLNFSPMAINTDGMRRNSRYSPLFPSSVLSVDMPEALRSPDQV